MANIFELPQMKQGRRGTAGIPSITHDRHFRIDEVIG
jgi:hypothetical protein